MKTVLLIVMMSLLAGSSAIAEPGPLRVQWGDNFEDALAEAVALRRPVLLSFTTTWCGWCRKLEAQTFRDQEFVRFASRLVPVMVDGDKERGLTSMFRVRGYPTNILLDRRGREIARVSEYQPPQRFIQSLMAGMSRRENFAEAHRAVEESPNDPEALYEMADIYMALGRYEEAKPLLIKVLEIDPKNTTGLYEDAQLDYSLAAYLSRDLTTAIPEFQTFFKKFPNSPRKDSALLFYGMALLDAGEKEKGRKVLEDLRKNTDTVFVKQRATSALGE